MTSARTNACSGCARGSTRTPTRSCCARPISIDPRTDERYRGLAPIVGREVERLLNELPPPSASAEARRVIARLLPSGTPEGDAVARAMSVSLRTLQRRLADEGTTIRDLVESTREGLALAYLASDRLSIGEISYLLGYSEPGTFTTAFKRWKSMSPSEYRQELAAGP